MPVCPLRGDVELSARGSTYVFRLGINELITLQSALGFEDEDEFLQKVGTLKSVKALRTIASCCLVRKEGAKVDDDGYITVIGVDERVAGDVLSEVGVTAFVRTIAKAMSLAWADPSEEAGESTGKASRVDASPGRRSSKTAPRPA